MSTTVNPYQLSIDSDDHQCQEEGNICNNLGNLPFSGNLLR